MNKNLIKQKFTRNLKLASIFLISSFVVTNSYATKLTLNGQPPASIDSADPVLNIDSNNTNIIYSYSADFGPIMTNTIEPFLCIGPNLSVTPTPGATGSPQVNFMDVQNNPEKVYGIVDVLSAIYDYNLSTSYIPADRIFKLQTKPNSQCVVKGFVWNDDPATANQIIFSDSFETVSGTVVATFNDLKINLYKDFSDNDMDDDTFLNSNLDISDQALFDYYYVIYNNGEEAVNFDIADYFYLENDLTSVLSSVWTCNKSNSSVGATNCGKNPLYDYNAGGIQADTDGSSNPPNYTGSVYLRNAHIEQGDTIIIKVTRQSDISVDTPIDLFVSTLITGAIDSQQLNNSDVRSFNGIVNAVSLFVNTSNGVTPITELSATIDEDSSTVAIALKVTDADAADILTVTANSLNTEIVPNVGDMNYNNNIVLVDNGSGNWTVQITSLANANTILEVNGLIDIELNVSDTKSTLTIPLHLTITPINDKPTFSLDSLVDHPAQSSGQKQFSMFMNLIKEGPTDDEIMNQSIIDNTPNDQNADNVKIEFVSGTPDILALSSLPVLGTNGNLSYFLSGTTGGTAIYKVTILDDAGTSNDSNDDLESDPVEFSITVLNTKPTIELVTAADASIEFDEDTTSSIVNLTIMDAETQNLGCSNIIASSDNTSIIALAGISIGGSDTNCTITITPIPNQNTTQSGNVNISIKVNDGMSDSDIPVVISVAINPINDAPTFSLGSDLNHLIADAVFQQFLGFATALSMGPTADEDLNQNVMNYNIQVTDASLIFDQSTVALDINDNGTLQYILSGNVGTATIMVSLQDDGMTVNGGVDTSATQSFTITVNSPPVASNVVVTGTAAVGNTLTGSYDYADVDNDSEGTSTFRWLSGGSPIASATATTYILIAADSGTNISFEVTPVASTGETTGMVVVSSDVLIP